MVAKGKPFLKGASGNPRGRPVGSKDKSTVEARQAIASFIDGNVERINGWLEEIYQQQGPRAAFDSLSSLLEYHVPKLARVEHTGPDEGPVELVIKWKE